MNARTVSLALLGSVLAASSPVRAQGRPDNAAIKSQVSAAWQKFGTDLKASDSTSLAMLFTGDAMIAYNTEARGTDEVRSYWGRMARTYVFDAVTFTTEDFTVSGDLATDFGVLSQSIKRKAGKATAATQRIRYAAIWKRQGDGTWKVYRFVATVPAPTG